MDSYKPKLLVMGYAEHGKGTTCEILLRKYGLTAMSSSYFANELLIYPKLKDIKGYKTALECYDDRYNNRQFWYEEIKAYNTPDGTRLARALYEQFDIYDGVRNVAEFEAMRDAKLFDLSLWIDASERKPKESMESCTVTPEMADLIIGNNLTTRHLEAQLVYVLDRIFKLEHLDRTTL